MPGGILSSLGCFTYHKKGGYPSPPLRQYNSGPYAQVITSLSPFPASASKRDACLLPKCVVYSEQNKPPVVCLISLAQWHTTHSHPHLANTLLAQAIIH